MARSGLVSRCALTSAVMRDTGGDGGDSWGDFGFDGSLPLLPLRESVLTTSFTIPTLKHFWNLQNWHLFLRLLSTGQDFSARQTYLLPFWTVLLKKPRIDEKLLAFVLFVRWVTSGDGSETVMRAYLCILHMS